MKSAALVAIADAAGVTVEWLATGRGPMLRDAPPAPGDAVAVQAAADAPAGYVAIPRYNVQASAGNGALVEHEQIVEFLAFSERYLRETVHTPPGNLLTIEARGDSMEPTIRDGDLMLIDVSPDQPLETGKLYVIRVAEELQVKRLQHRLDGGVAVLSDNPRYAPELIPRADLENLHILGRVLWVAGPPRS